MASRKKGNKGKPKTEKSVDSTPEPKIIEPNPPKPRLVLAVTFGILAFGWLGYLLAVAIAGSL